MENTAPYASTAIPLYLMSVTGTQYRSLNCLECGKEFLERGNSTMYRINDESQPSEIAISAAQVMAICGNCSQQYSLNISISVEYARDSIPLYLQPQSIYFSAEPKKRLRFVHCLECGKTFHSISDRISQIIDNRVPFEYLSPERLGPLEQVCPWSRCGQTWALMI